MLTAKVRLDTLDRAKSFVNAMTKLDCDVDILYGSYIIDAKSIMGVVNMELDRPLEVKAHATPGTKLAEDFMKEVGPFED